VVATVQVIIGVPVSGRPAKSTSSIIEKLNRESIRLSQMQDIAGCRAIVIDLPHQDIAMDAIVQAFGSVAILDRRERPSHGYRAVHLIVREAGKPIEVQIRTALQHVWAEMSEKLADLIDPSIKYGGGPLRVRKVLDNASTQVGIVEDLEAKLARAGASNGVIARQLRDTRDDYVATLRSLIEDLNESDTEEFS